MAGILGDKEGGGLEAIPASRGEFRRIDVAGFKRGRYYWPEFLPGGNDLLFHFAPVSSEGTEVYLARFDGSKVTDPILLFENDTAVLYTPAGGGRILFVRDNNLYAQKLDLSARKLEAVPELTAQDVASFPVSHLAYFSVARNGSVAWRSGKAELSQITVFNRQGKQRPLASAWSITIS